MKHIDLEVLAIEEELVNDIVYPQVEEFYTKLEDLASQIRNGKATTGDPVQDFAFTLAGGRKMNVVLPPLQTLYDTVNNNIGNEFALVMHERTKEAEYGCLGSFGETSILHQVVGVIEGPIKFEVSKNEEENIIIPMKYHIANSQDSSFYLGEIPATKPLIITSSSLSMKFRSGPDADWKREQGAITFNALLLYSALDGDLYANRGVQSYAGEEVREHFFKIGHSEHAYNSMLEALTEPESK